MKICRCKSSAGKVVLQEAALLAQPSTGPSTSAAAQQTSAAVQASGDRFDSKASVANVSSSSQPRSLMQAVSLTSYPFGVANEDAESPLGGRPVQSETALLKGRAAAMTEPQDLHAAHLMHVLEAHTTQLRHTNSILGTELKLGSFRPDTELQSVGSGLASQLSAEPLNREGSKLSTHSESQQGDDNEPFHLQGSLSGANTTQAAFPQPIQASDVSTVQMSQAAQPILFPVMPMAAASAQAGSTVQPVLDSSLRLDISKPSHEATGAGPAGAQHQIHSVQDVAVDGTSGLGGFSQAQTQQLPLSGLSDSFGLPNSQISAHQGILQTMQRLCWRLACS